MRNRDQNIAVVGAGPAGLASAHRLAMNGHDVVVFDAREKAGGLNEYGIAAYKTVNNFAQAEVDEAVRFADESPEPPLEEVWTDVYAA